MTTSGSPPPAGRPSEARSSYVERVLPTAQSVLWQPRTPTGVARRSTSGGSYSVFFDQKAIAAVHAHYETAGRQGMIGFLVGDLLECPTSRVRYVIIDSTIRLNQAVYGDKTLVIVSRLWDRIHDELQKIEGHLLGWYHSHPPSAVELASGDVETHLQYFKRPWHVALVLGAEYEGPVAGLFRPGPGETAPTVSLPFYELIESDEGLAGGKKRSILPWLNFATEDPAVVHAQVRGETTPAPASPRSTIEVVRPNATRVAPPSGPVKAGKGTQPRPPLSATPPAPAAPLPPPPSPPPPARPAPPAAASSTPAGSEPGRRQTQMKPPPNALSNLPLLAAGGFDIGEVETRSSDPGVMTPRPEPVLPPRRRPTHTPKPFAPALAPKRRGGHGGLLAALALLLAGGGVAGWYFYLRHPVLGGASLPPAAPLPPAAVPATGPESVAASPPVDSNLLVFDRVADSVRAVVRGYGAATQRFGAGRLDCAGLSQGLVAVEDAWTTYNLGKRKAAALDAARRTRDQTLSTAVDSVESQFDASGCQRP